MPRLLCELSVLCVVLCTFFYILPCCLGAELPSCKDRGRNCTLCLQDGNCGFCDSCGDHCRKPGAIHSLKNCTDCSSCVPGTLAGPNKGTECRPEWFFFERCPEVVSEKKTVYVEIALYLMNIHSVDMKAGTFNADFYLYFKVPPGQTTYTKQKCKDGINGACFELVNAAGHAEVTSHEGKYFRVKSAFNFAVDVQNYPYDNQTLRIVIQDMEMSAKELRWRVMKGSDSGDFKFRSGVSPTLNYTGWLFDTNSWSQMVYEKYNPFLDQGVSRYEFLFHMKRHKRAAFFKNFLPPLFIVLVIGFSFSIPPKDATMRLWIDGSLLVSAVMFHATVGNETPDSQELTLADRFMVGVYSFIFVSFVVTIIMLRLQRENYYFLADIFYGYTEWLVWFTGPTFFFLLYYLRMSLYHVLLSELLIACSGLATCRLLSYLRCFLQKFLHVEEHPIGMDDDDDRTHIHQGGGCSSPSGYQPVPQEDQEIGSPVLPTRPCFPGTPAQSPNPCPKQTKIPNKAA